MAKVDLDYIINQLNYHPKRKLELFLELPNEQRAFVLSSLRKESQRKIIMSFNNGDLSEILEHLDSDEVTDIIQLLPKKKQKDVIEKLNDEIRNGVKFLSKFDPKTAAGLMSLNYIQVEETDTFGAVAKQIKIRERKVGKLPIVIVMRKGKIVGSLPGYRLGLCNAPQAIKRYTRKVDIVDHDAKPSELLRIFKKNPQSKVVVIGESGNVLGIIFANDVLMILGSEDFSSLYSFAGVKNEEGTFDSIFKKVKHRYKWLIVNLGTAFLAAGVVSSFDTTINRFVLLAAYMPIVAGMGGNAATQTLAIVVRGISLGEISFRNSFKFILNEVGAGVINGIINGTIVALIAIFWNQSPLLGLVTGTAIIANLIVAGFFGSVVPLFMKKIGKDPATSATVFITATTDVIGFFVFLGLASVIL
jgi:magnesium transporter